MVFEIPFIDRSTLVGIVIICYGYYNLFIDKKNDRLWKGIVFLIGKGYLLSSCRFSPLNDHLHAAVFRAALGGVVIGLRFGIGKGLDGSIFF